MTFRYILKIFLIVFFVIGTLNFVYANGGPVIGQNQARSSAQSYLNSHNLPYSAITPEWNDLKVKVNDTQTGEVKWIPVAVADEDQFNSGGEIRYKVIDAYPVWMIQINDKNGKNVGQIRVDCNTGEVLKVNVDPAPPNSQKQSKPANFTHAANATASIPPEPSNNNMGFNVGFILGVIILIIVVGTGYWTYIKKG
ncbi:MULTISPECIES: hypothetical protein [Methanobacterium]|uniref:PepSY domain-containing protein n=1 Tax=Methanobacterium veterum TaxID=408577 RepID=A0A9E4ZUN8_9EURY|nr:MULTISPECIES: hypothetical protein [Methanobacterium]MCZ3365509.1 hypothetical protein [Methanobacterium veterum]MCZ3373261.1 hypothetical protein [Methanobacterium veterum]